MFHADIMPVVTCFAYTLQHFYTFLGTNLLTRCLVPVPVICCVFVSEKLFGEVSWNHLKIYVNYFHGGTKMEPGGELQGAQPPHAT